MLQAFNANCKTNDSTDYIAKPVDALEDFTTSNPAPTGSTGWFVPSPKELYILGSYDMDDIYEKEKNWRTLNIVNTSLQALTAYDTIQEEYWSSSEYDETMVFVVNISLVFGERNRYTWSGFWFKRNFAYTCPVCAF